MATLGGAQALNLDDKIGFYFILFSILFNFINKICFFKKLLLGSLVVGKQFDALVINAHVEHGAFDVFDDFDQTTKVN